MPQVTLFLTVNLCVSKQGFISSHSQVLWGAEQTLRSEGRFLGEKRLLHFLFLTMRSQVKHRLAYGSLQLPRMLQMLLLWGGSQRKVSPCPWQRLRNSQVPFPWLRWVAVRFADVVYLPGL